MGQATRRTFLSVAGASVVAGAASHPMRLSAAAQGRGAAAPVSFPGIPNPLEGDVEVIAPGYIWTEGPVWVGGEQGHLLFSDVPGNAIYSWDGKRTTPWLAPAGYQGFPVPDTFREPGSNGLILGRGGLLIADCGMRGLSRVDLATRQKTLVVGTYQGKRFNRRAAVAAPRADVHRSVPHDPGQPGAPGGRQSLPERHRPVAGQPHPLLDRHFGLGRHRPRCGWQADGPATVRRVGRRRRRSR